MTNASYEYWKDHLQDICKHCTQDIFCYDGTWYHHISESYLCDRADFEGTRASPGGTREEDLPLAMVDEQEQS